VSLHHIHDRQTGVGPTDVTDENRVFFPCAHLQLLPKVSVTSNSLSDTKGVICPGSSLHSQFP